MKIPLKYRSSLNSKDCSHLIKSILCSHTHNYLANLQDILIVKYVFRLTNVTRFLYLLRGSSIAIYLLMLFDIPIDLRVHSQTWVIYILCVHYHMRSIINCTKGWEDETRWGEKNQEPERLTVILKGKHGIECQMVCKIVCSPNNQTSAKHMNSIGSWFPIGYAIF